MTEEEVREQEANYFAMCLLMPERFVKDEVAKLPRIDFISGEGLKDLAKKFGVTVPLITLRLHQLAVEDPVWASTVNAQARR